MMITNVLKSVERSVNNDNSLLDYYVKISKRSDYMNQFSGMDYAQLADHITEAVGELKRKAYGEGYRQGNHEARYGDGAAPVSKALTRAEVVRKANADIDGLKNESKRYDYGIFEVKAEFIVNSEKRTVVALLRGKGSGKIHTKGIAKCAPGDCFNSEIGKAIALRRALNLEVPSEYTNAPKPEGYHNYDKIITTKSDVYTITPTDQYEESISGDQCQVTAPVVNGAKVIDDSARNYEGAY